MPTDTDIATFIAAAFPPDNAHASGTLDVAARMLADNPALAAATFWTALTTGHTRFVSRTLDRDPDAARRPGGPKQWAPLLYVCFSRFLRFDDQRLGAFNSIVRMLLDCGGDPNAHFMLGDEKETALYAATGVANRPSIVRMLLDEGADPDDGEVFYHGAEHEGMAALKAVFNTVTPPPHHCATSLLRRLDFEGYDDIAWLLAHGCDPNETRPFGKSAMHQAILRQRDPSYVELLLSHGGDPTRPDHAGFSALTLAIILGAEDEAALMRAVTDDQQPRPTDQALLVACARQDQQTIDALCADDPSLASSVATTHAKMLVELAGRGRTATITRLLDLGFNIEQTGDWGGTAIHHASWYGHAETVRLLAKRGAALEFKNAYGGTVLDAAAWAVSHGPATRADYLDVIEVLLEAGADANAVGPFPTGVAELDALIAPHRSA